MALAVVTVAALYPLLPADFRLFAEAVYVLPAFLLALLGVLIVGDPGRIDREAGWLRTVTGIMIAWITTGASISAVRLVDFIVNGVEFGGASDLLMIGGVVWVNVVIAFALWYWQLDSGGPAARAHRRADVMPAFRFPEHDLDDERYAAWYPQFVDYLTLSFYTATSFAAADVSAVRHWAKLWIMAESAISFAIVGLVVANAVNTL